MVFDEILRAIQFPEIGVISACPLKSSEFLSFCSFGLFLSYFISNRMQVCRIIYLCIILLVCNSMHITIRDFIPTATEEVPSSIFFLIIRLIGFAVIVKICINTLILKMYLMERIIMWYKIS